MTNAFTKMLDVEAPIAAFSHSPAVVAAASQAGALGIFGAQRFTPDELDDALTWIERNCDGRPFGVDVLYPLAYVSGNPEQLAERIPAEHRRFVADLVQRFEIPEPTSESRVHEFGGNIVTQEGVGELIEVALAHRTRLLVSALGPLPGKYVDAAKSRGIVVGGLVANPRHAVRHLDAGAQILVAQGTEAAGHTGEISTLVVVPQIVDVAGGAPVLAAGGIGNGRQLAAAVALGAQGVWAGSVWLTTHESDTPELLKDKLLGAVSTDTIRSASTTGKPVRIVRSAWTDAWAADDAPKPLEAPLQGMLTHRAIAGALEHGVREVMTGAVGQVVGQMTERRSVAEVIADMLAEAATAAGSVSALIRTQE